MNFTPSAFCANLTQSHSGLAQIHARGIGDRDAGRTVHDPMLTGDQEGDVNLLRINSEPCITAMLMRLGGDDGDITLITMTESNYLFAFSLFFDAIRIGVIRI